MDYQALIGRESQRQELDRCLASNRSELVVIYGRRRIGKTFLIEQHFNKKFDFWYVGVRNLKTREQLRRFAEALKGFSGRKDYKFRNWFSAFDALKEYLQTLPSEGKRVVFIDEMPWMDSGRSNFIKALEDFWNGWAASRGNIMLIATGSSTSWMRDKLISNRGGLHARITSQMYLQPFSLYETELYLKSQDIQWDRYLMLQAYMLLGGVPFYYSLLNRQWSLAKNIDELCFRPGGKLRVEFDELYNALFKFADRYIEIVKTLSRHQFGLTYAQLSEAMDFQGSQLTRALKNLERSDFIEKWPQYGNKKREEVYRLSDFYTLFYYKFLDDNDIREDDWWSKNQDSPYVLSWMGTSFEKICLRHYRQIKEALGLRVVSTSLATWQKQGDKNERGAQVDMLIERADRILHLCEIKFSVRKYSLSKAYEDRLRERMTIFADATKCRKTIVNTFITTYGVAGVDNHSIVHSEVTLDDLFQP